MAESLQPTTLVIFGVSGDLSQRYLLPALAEICQSSDLRAHLRILGISRHQITAKEILTKQTKGLVSQFETYQMDYDSAADYQKLKSYLKGHDTEQVIFYFAVPPAAVLPIVGRLGAAKMNTSSYKLLMEKPFGTDLASAKKLIEQTNRHFKEEQVYRIDHYLAKEMAQNITVFLGSNVLFRDVWNNQFIEKIEIAAEESIGVEGRGHFYEQTGALRDIVQSHLLQLTALTLMEPCPDVFDFSQVQPRRLAALKSLEVDKRSVIRAQYDGYRQDVGNPKSSVETFVSLTLKSNSPKWQGVPIKLITGKKLKQKLTEIRIFFKKTQSAQANLLRLRIQPREAIELELWIKKPGYEQELQKLPLDFAYQQYFGRLPDAYEQVIVDAIRSRTNLFASSSEVFASWTILQPLLDDFGKNQPKLKTYKPGSAAADIAE
jgi:glucose-6-phosphate 1-dehydrogenase